MTSTQEALSIVLDSAHKYGEETVLLSDSIGRVLSEDIMADRPFPPFDRVTMDGIAISFESWESDKTIYDIENIAPAGSPQVTLQDQSKCIEVMTGAVLPKGTDTVIRYEDLESGDNLFSITTEIKKGQNIHTEGSDNSPDSILLKRGDKIKAIDVNILATVGKSSVSVFKYPQIAIVSSGNELVSVDSKPQAHQIRMSNVHMIAARLVELGVASEHFHIQDDVKEINITLSNIISNYDVILMSGGVSKGKFDYIPDALQNLGVKKLFHRVAQRPGKPLWYGRNERVTVFAFPGNPVSTLSCFHKYFIPWLYKSTGQEYRIPSVILKSRTSFKPELTYFAQAKLSFENGRMYADISKGNGSGDMAHPTKMDGFLELPSDKDVFEAGEVYDFIPFYSILK